VKRGAGTARFRFHLGVQLVKLHIIHHKYAQVVNDDVVIFVSKTNIVQPGPEQGRAEVW